jgi:hypothetical protein
LEQLLAGGYANDHLTTQDIAVTPIFPAQCRLDLTELPSDLQPIQELFGGSSGVNLRGVMGFVIAYEDVNRNGMLDLVTSASPGYKAEYRRQSSSSMRVPNRVGRVT